MAAVLQSKLARGRKSAMPRGAANSSDIAREDGTSDEDSNVQAAACEGRQERLGKRCLRGAEKPSRAAESWAHASTTACCDAFTRSGTIAAGGHT